MKVKFGIKIGHGFKNILTSGLSLPPCPPRLSRRNFSWCCGFSGTRAVEVKFRIHLNIKRFWVGKDVDAFFDLSIQTFLVCSLNFDFKASVVLYFVWVDFVQVPRKCIWCCVAVDWGFVAFKSVISREPEPKKLYFLAKNGVLKQLQPNVKKIN